MKTVLFVSAVSGHGGPNASLKTVLPRLRGIRPILAGPYVEEEARAMRRQGWRVEVIARPRGMRRRIRAILELLVLAWKVRLEQPEVFANGLTEAAVVSPAMALLGMRGVVWVHNYAPPRVALAMRPLLRWLIGRGRWRLFSVSTMAADVARSAFFPDSEVRIVPNPITRQDLVAIHRRATSGRRLRVAYVAGTDRPYKGFDLLPAILAKADPLGIDWLVVSEIGTQPRAWDELHAVIKRFRHSQAEIRGRTDHVVELYEWADVILVPSRQESFCRVAAEAMASGAAVVAARLPAVVEVCGEVGYYFPVEDIGSAVAVLECLNSDRALVEAAADGGRERSQRFGVESVVDRWQRILTA